MIYLLFDCLHNIASADTIPVFAQQDEYSILNSKHFIGIHGYMLVYSVSSLPSFEMVQVIREKILSHLVWHLLLFPLLFPLASSNPCSLVPSQF